MELHEIQRKLVKKSVWFLVLDPIILPTTSPKVRAHARPIRSGAPRLSRNDRKFRLADKLKSNIPRVFHPCDDRDTTVPDYVRNLSWFIRYPTQEQTVQTGHVCRSVVRGRSRRMILSRASSTLKKYRAKLMMLFPQISSHIDMSICSVRSQMTGRTVVFKTTDRFELCRRNIFNQKEKKPFLNTSNAKSRFIFDTPFLHLQKVWNTVNRSSSC